MAKKETRTLKNWKEISKFFKKRDFDFKKCKIIAIGYKEGKLKDIELECK